MHTEEESEENICSLRLGLFRKGVTTTTSYDASSGLKGRLVLSGWIDDRFDDNSHFHNKPVRVEFSFPPNTAWLAKVLNETASDKACGVVQINTNIEPERFELEGEIVEEEPVRVELEVSTDSFEVIRRQVSNADEQHLEMEMEVTLVGNTLPQQKNSLGIISLKDLDVSKHRIYAVSGFEIYYNTRSIDHMHGRVRQIEPDRDEKHGTMISILLVGFRDEVSIERGIAHRISCDGRLVNARGTPYDGADVAIEFYEHEQNRHTGELPERAFFGEFGFWPKQTDEEYSAYHFSLDLKHNPEDIPNLLLPLLTHDVQTKIFLDVYLEIENKELLEATDELRGKVRYYKFDVRRELTNKA